MSVVFTDNFTNSSGSDVNIDAWPSSGAGADYAYSQGSGANIRVSNANDRVELAYTTTPVPYARIIDAAGAITGDQEITATCSYGSDQYSEAVLCVRMATSATLTNFYIGSIEADTANEVKLCRVDNGTNTLLASQDQGITNSPQTSGTHVLKATGTNPVALTYTCRGGTPITYSDSSASRKSSGVPGFGGLTPSGPISHIDNLSVDDLAVTTVNLAASLSASIDATAVASLTKPLAASVSASVDGTAVASLTKPLAAAIAASVDASAVAASITKNLQATHAGSIDASAVILSITKALAVSISSTIDATATPAITKNLQAAISTPSIDGTATMNQRIIHYRSTQLLMFPYNATYELILPYEVTHEVLVT